MDILPISNQVRAHDDEEDQPENLDDGDNSVREGAIFQEPDQGTLSCYYHQHLEQTQNATRKSFDAHLGKRHELFTTAAISTSSDHTKIQCERSMQEGFGLLSPKLKSKRRKTDVIEDHGGRIVPSTGRKDRHSKVCTARGTRDRRVRLSPKTAIMFYDVQDRLGYDRPSKAIDWLMQEAKAAIDALDEPPPVAANVAEIHGPSNSKKREMLKTDKCGMIHQKLEHLNVGNSIGLFTEGVAPSSSTHDQFQAYLNDDFNSTMSRSDQAQKVYQEQSLCAPLTIPSEIFGTNSENVMLQRIFSSNYGNAGGAGEDYSSSVNSLPLHFPAPVDVGHSHMFSGHRESLQSSYSRITNCSPQFPEHVSFCNEELPNFTAATFKED